MKRIHINGWLRIYIVISVLWMIGNPLYVIEQNADDRRAIASAAYDRCDAANPKGVYSREATPWRDCMEDWQAAYKAFSPPGPASIPFQNAFYVWLIYSAVIGLIVGTIRWIISGFRKPTRELAD